MQHSNSTFTILNAVESTNNYAMAKVHAGMAKHGDAYFSYIQTMGKGQRGRVWRTGEGKNIAISIVLEPVKLKLSQQFQLSVAISMACFDLFSAYAGNETKIKWPNDIYWRDRKAGGILIENIVGKLLLEKHYDQQSSWKYAITGIGLNINQTTFDPELKNPVSLKQITGKETDPVELARDLQQLVLKRFEELFTQPFEKILQQYNSCLYKGGQLVQLKKNNIIFETMVKEVTENGQLFTIDRIDNFFDFGEVEWIL
jgi:BirA family biotin operon repressor/biotin-[acetyl-CoA-carboxylase] ligase